MPGCAQCTALEPLVARLVAGLLWLSAVCLVLPDGRDSSSQQDSSSPTLIRAQLHTGSWCEPRECLVRAPFVFNGSQTLLLCCQSLERPILFTLLDCVKVSSRPCDYRIRRFGAQLAVTLGLHIAMGAGSVCEFDGLCQFSQAAHVCRCAANPPLLWGVLPVDCSV